MTSTKYLEEIRQHYRTCWNGDFRVRHWDRGPKHELPLNFSVLCFEPRPERKMWTYATSGMSLLSDPSPVELHLFAPHEDDQLVEVLTAVCHFHRHESFLHLGDTVNFGRPWLDDSLCEFGLISLPYLDGPTLEWKEIDSLKVQFLWLVPITKAERQYKKQFGLEALEAKLEAASFDYVNPERASAVKDEAIS